MVYFCRCTKNIIKCVEGLAWRDLDKANQNPLDLLSITKNFIKIKFNLRSFKDLSKKTDAQAAESNFVLYYVICIDFIPL